ncbi:MAG TPA: hypothetical protein VIB80_00785 [Aquiluna sp.]
MLNSERALPLIAALAVWLPLSYFYHPTTGTILAGAVIGVGLSALIFWSGERIPLGKTWWIKILAVSTVAGLMNSSALDVAYSIMSAPLGNRFGVVIEMIISGLVLTGLALAQVFLGPKKEK